MKTKYFLLAACFIGTLSTVACKKCQTCNVQATEIEVCRDDYGSQQLYDAYIISLEQAGYECN